MPLASTSGSFFTLRCTIISSAAFSVSSPCPVISDSTGVIREATVPSRVLTKRTSRSVRRPFRRRAPSTTTSVPAFVRFMVATASASGVSGATAYGSRMMMCCIRLTFSTSRTCGPMSPLLKPRSMMPMPPSSAWTIAIGARVTVSMLADTSGRLSVMFVEKRQDRSITDGSRRVMMLYCGRSRKSSKVAPRTMSASASKLMGLMVSLVSFSCSCVLN